MKLASITAFVFAVASSVVRANSLPDDDIEPAHSRLEARREKWPVGGIKDDYPWKNDCEGNDIYGFKRCTDASFVAYRINNRLKKQFKSWVNGTHWGDASTWIEAATKAGIPIDDYPWAGSIGYTNKSIDGTPGHHVVWVAKAPWEQVTYEAFNYRFENEWEFKKVSKEKFQWYIHIRDVIFPPTFWPESEIHPRPPEG